MSSCCRQSLNCTGEIMMVLDGGKPICTRCAQMCRTITDPEMKNKFLYALAWKKWDALQYTVLFEEMSELQKEICKRLRLEHYAKNPRDDAHMVELAEKMRINVKNICEEIADTQIMIDQMKERFGEEEVEKVRQEKLRRLAEMLK